MQIFQALLLQYIRQTQCNKLDGNKLLRKKAIIVQVNGNKNGMLTCYHSLVADAILKRRLGRIVPVIFLCNPASIQHPSIEHIEDFDGPAFPEQKLWISLTKVDNDGAFLKPHYFTPIPDDTKSRSGACLLSGLNFSINRFNTTSASSTGSISAMPVAIKCSQDFII